MANYKNELQASFQAARRHSNYGNVITSMVVKGFRNHVDTHIEIESPVTAFCGVNGTGKSTLLQLAAASYDGITKPRVYISSFILAGHWDTKPFSESASMEICYAEPVSASGKIEEKKLTISRSGSSWAGYDRQPIRDLLYLGLGFHIPLSERDSGFKEMFEEENFQIEDEIMIENIILENVSKILLCGYDEAHVLTIRKKWGKSCANIINTKRCEGPKYSEANMGSGEARLYALVMKMETVPEKSLVLIEEPETSLHPSAQFELGKYFAEVAKRRGLQIMMTTHSEYLLLALPQKSRIFLKREGAAIKPIPGICVRQAISMMDEIAFPSLYILVEDDVAEAIVKELLRKHDEDFLKTVRFFVSGDKDKISTVMHVLQDLRMPICAVRDGDFGSERKIMMFKLFGNEAPEIEIFKSPSFRSAFAKQYGIDWGNIDIVNRGKDHHRWFDVLVAKTARTRTEILSQAAVHYLDGISETERQSLVEQIKAVLP